MEQKNDSGALFKNEKKAAENHPDYTGRATIEGQQYNVAAWIRTSQAGSKYMSLSFSIPQPKSDAAPQAVSKPANIQQEDDGLPF